MKNFILIAAVVVGFSSCKNKELEQEVASLKEINKELQAANHDQDSSITGFMETFNEISQNLAEIREKESSIELNSENKSADSRERIKEDLTIINDLMDQNRAKIDDLDKKLKWAWSSNAKIKKSMETLKEDFMAQIDAKDNEINTLRDELANMNITVEELNQNLASLNDENILKDEAIEEKNQVIEAQTAVINTAYYKTGNAKELVAQEIITKEGGIIGLGASKQLNANLNTSNFEQIDITQIKEIPLNGKKAELVTNHPADSYKIEGEDKEVSKLVILSPEKFWNSSKYLVVMVD
ncbi:hypothetical protein [Flexithrix dorotheae]|uniref:Cbp1 family collagen-binding glycoprotein adhesin n=1 Tax=Flexithrix dorotheae TaxID=70993 RepID=UPI0003A906FB|nr:hypothetical protein [Flexithrix dorotheae]